MSFLDLSGFQPGDALTTHSPSWRGRLVQLLAGDYFDHIAILAPHPKSGRLCVYEAEQTPANCLVTHRKRAGFRCRPLKEWLEAAQDGGCEVWHVPLRKPLSRITARMLTAMLTQWCRDRIAYDLEGAIRVRKWGFRWATRWHWPCKEDQSALFCVESVAIAWQYLERIELKNTAAWAVDGFVRLARKQRAVLKPRLVENPA